MDSGQDPRIAIVCCPRPTPNVHSTLAGLLLSDPRAARCHITLCIDSGPDLLLRDLYGHLGVELLFLGSEEQRAQAGRSGAHRGRYNHGRAIRSGAGHPGGILVLEDDVAFARGWLDAATGDKLVWGYGQPPTGALWVYYPARLVAEAAGGALAFDAHATPDSKPGAGIDLWLGMWARDKGELIRVVPVAQHLGDTSMSGHGHHGIRRSGDWRAAYDATAPVVYSRGAQPIAAHLTHDRARRYARRGLIP